MKHSKQSCQHTQLAQTSCSQTTHAFLRLTSNINSLNVISLNFSGQGPMLWWTVSERINRYAFQWIKLDSSLPEKQRTVVDKGDRICALYERIQQAGMGDFLTDEPDRITELRIYFNKISGDCRKKNQDIVVSFTSLKLICWNED